VVQRAGALAHALDGFAGVVPVVPCERQREQLVDQFVGKPPAGMQGDVALEHPPGTMEGPARGRGEEARQQPAPRGADPLQAASLHRVDRLRGEPRYGEPEELGAEQEPEGADDLGPAALRQPPQFPVERRDAVACRSRIHAVVSLRGKGQRPASSERRITSSLSALTISTASAPGARTQATTQGWVITVAAISPSGGGLTSTRARSRSPASVASSHSAR